MANETENQAQLRNDIKEIKSQSYSSSLHGIEKLKLLIANLLSLVKDSGIEKQLLDLQKWADEKEEQIRTSLKPENVNGNEGKNKEELEKTPEFLENEERERDLKLLVAVYNTFKDDFLAQQKEENDLLRRGLNGNPPLTDKERNELLGKYSTEQEELVALQKSEEMVKRYEIHCTIEEKATESIEFRQSAIQKNRGLIEDPTTPEEVRKRLEEENKQHNAVIKGHEKIKEANEPVNLERENTRKLIRDYIKKDKEVAFARLEEHLHRYGGRYLEEKQRDPNHQGHNEILTIVNELEVHKKLGITSKEGNIKEVVDNIKEKRGAALKKALASSPKPEEVNKEADSIVQTVQKSQTNSSVLKPPATPIVPSNKRLQHGNTEVKKGWVK